MSALYGNNTFVDIAPQSWEPSTTWEAKVKAITWRLDDQLPRFRHEQWKQVFEKQLATTPFTIQAADPLFSLPIGEQSIPFTYWMSKEAIWDRYSTMSQIVLLNPREKEVSFAVKLLQNLGPASTSLWLSPARIVWG